MTLCIDFLDFVEAIDLIAGLIRAVEERMGCWPALLGVDRVLTVQPGPSNLQYFV